MTAPTVVSAPGKVFVAGGYLVLDPLYSGLILATSSRFYAVAHHPSSSTQLPNEHSAVIRIRAGQFPAEGSTWTYTLSLSDGRLELQQEGQGSNKFVEITLRKALEYALEQLVSSGSGAAELLSRAHGKDGVLEVVVLADNDFYSQRESLSQRSLPPLYSSLSSLPPFNPLPRPIHQTNKTGLGSSAALVTSLTTALLTHLRIVDLSPATLDAIHNLAQLSHCLAQGKVGSGFDISTAVYGSLIYTRFSPSILTPLMTAPASPTLNADQGLLGALDGKHWDHKIRSFRLPRGLRLMLADVDAGTDTPSFVGKVLKWREAEKDTAKQLWEELGAANDSLGVLIQELCDREGDSDYDAVIQQAAQSGIDKLEIGHPVSQLLVRIRAALTLIRLYLQHMSRLSTVPIEPEEQTRLIDACSALPGILGGGVPGAGGYDAIYLLAIDDPSVVAGVEGVWAKWTELSVCPLSARQSDGGIRLEKLDEVAGLRERIEQ